MKKSLLRGAFMAMLLPALLCVTALAADGVESQELGAGFYMEKSSGLDIQPVADATTSIVKDEVGYTYYVGAEKMEVYCDAEDGEQCLVMLVTGTVKNDVPSTDNQLIYVNQKAASGGMVSFTEADQYVYPNLDSVGKDEVLTLLVIGSKGTKEKAELYYTTGGSYDVRTYKLGDVDGNDTINPADALEVLKHAVGKTTLTGSAFLSADVNRDADVTVLDALEILKFSVGKITSFD